MDCCSNKENKEKSSARNPLVTFAIIAFIVIAGGVILGLVLGRNSSAGSVSEISGSAPKIIFEHNSFDAGDISMAKGIFNHVYKIQNRGKSVLKLSKIETTCMCTEARIRYKGDESPKFGMPGMDSHAGQGPVASFWSGAEIAPGDEAELVVDFDPNAHGPDAIGLIKRGIILTTNDPENNKAEVFFSGNVIH